MEVHYHNEVSLTGRISGISATRLPDGYAVRFRLNIQRRSGGELESQSVPCVLYDLPGRCHSVHQGAVVMLSGHLTTEHNGGVDVVVDTITELQCMQIMPE